MFAELSCVKNVDTTYSNGCFSFFKNRIDLFNFMSINDDMSNIPINENVLSLPSMQKLSDLQFRQFIFFQYSHLFHAFQYSTANALRKIRQNTGFL